MFDFDKKIDFILSFVLALIVWFVVLTFEEERTVWVQMNYTFQGSSFITQQWIRVNVAASRSDLRGLKKGSLTRTYSVLSEQERVVVQPSHFNFGKRVKVLSFEPKVVYKGRME